MGVPNRLGMKDWIVLETQEDAYNMRVVAGKPVQPEVCPRCGVENPRVYKHDQQDQTFMDTPMHGKRVAVHVMRQRWGSTGGYGFGLGTILLIVLVLYLLGYLHG